LTSTPTVPKRASGRVEGRGDLRGVADVGGHRDRLAPRGLHGPQARVQMLGHAAGDHDARAEPGELDRHRLAEPGAAAGDQHHLAGVGVGRQHRAAGGRRRGQAAQTVDARVGHQSSTRFCSRITLPKDLELSST
jgi:hypothetical protein